MSKIKVLLVVDVKNWAFDNIAKSLVSNATEFVCSIIYNEQIKTTKYDQYEIIHFFHWSLYYHWKRYGFSKKDHQSITLGIHGYHNSKEELELIKEMSALSVVCKGIEHTMHESGVQIPMYYCPDGVDIRFFKKKIPLFRNGVITLGWTGNSAWGWDNKDTKGLHTIIKPAVEALGGRFNFQIADRNIKWRTQLEMVDWYNTVDVVICASACEGTPLPLLEASACGRAVITTNVGIVPEFYNGSNAILFDRSKENLQKTLAGLTREVITEIASNAQKNVQSWDRRRLTKNYEKMWNNVIRRYISITANPLENNYGGVEVSASQLTQGLQKLGCRAFHRTKTDPLDIKLNDVVLVHCWDERELIERVSKKTNNMYICIHHLCFNQINWILPTHPDYRWLQGGIKNQEETINRFKNIFVFNPYQRDLARVRYGVKAGYLINGITPVIDGPIEKKPGSVMFSGRCEDHKGFHVFVAAVNNLFNGTVKSCTVAGHVVPGSSAINPHPKINFLGKVPRSKVLKTLSETQILVAPSRYESFPYAILEAGLYKTCVIATDLPGYREIFGDAIVYVPQEDPEAIREKITHLISFPDQAKAMGEKLHNLVVKKYTDIEMARHFLRSVNP